MTALEQLILLIKESEGCKLKAYPDPGTGDKPWTIGWGATGAGIKKGVTWTQHQADERLVYDAKRCINNVLSCSPILGDEPPQRLAAIADFIYNLGSTRYYSSTLRKKVNAGEWDAVKSELMKWVHAGGKVLPGLVRRRQKEASLI